MRYVMSLFIAAFLLAPVVGCTSNKETVDKTNPITGTHTHEEHSSSSSN